MLSKDIRKDFYDVILRQHVVIMVGCDVDALCAAKILQWLLRCDHVSYTLITIANISELRRAAYDTSTLTKTFVFINCGGSIDLVGILDPSADVRFFVIDSRRPLHVSSVYSERQVVCLLDSAEDTSNIPECADVLWDGSEPDDSDDDDEPSSGRNFDNLERRILRRNKFRMWSSRQKRILFDYTEFSSFETATAFLFYELAWKLSKDNNDLMWWAILGCTEQFVQEKIDAEKYMMAVNRIQSHVLRLNHSITSDALRYSVDCLKLTFENELRMEIYKHWTLYESLRHTTRTACHFQSWTVKGQKKLMEFLVDLGLPLAQCKQKFAGMDVDLRREMKGKIEAKLAKYNITNLSMGTFTAQYAFTHKFTASDIVSSVSALLENGQKDSYEKSFHLAFDSLSRSHVDLLYSGLKLHQEMCEAALRIIQSIVNTGGILPHPSFLTAHLESGTPELHLFTKPIAMRRLATFLLSAFVATTKSRRFRSLPLILSIPQFDDPENIITIIGIPPVTLESSEMRKNFFGKAFEQAAFSCKARLVQDNFESSVSSLHMEDRERFFAALTALMAS